MGLEKLAGNLCGGNMKNNNFDALVKSPIFQILVLIGFAFIISGCGIKGPPIPPRHVVPPAVNDLIKSIDGNILRLTWTIPGEKEMFTSGDAGFIVYSSKTLLSEPYCKDCPVLFTRVADIPIETKDLEKKDEGIIKYSETLEKGYRYIFKVNTYLKGATSSDSNRVDFVFK